RGHRARGPGESAVAAPGFGCAARSCGWPSRRSDVRVRVASYKLRRLDPSELINRNRIMDMDAICDRRAAAGPPASARTRELEPAALLERFRAVRSASLQLVSELSAEDQCVQSMPAASP